MRNRAGWLAALSALTLVAPGFAQGNSVQRAQAPSQNVGRIGRVGGYSTGGSDLFDPYGRRAGGQNITGGVLTAPGTGPSAGALGFQRNRFMMSNEAAISGPPAIRARIDTMPIRSFAPSQRDLSAMSGFDTVVNPYRRMGMPIAPPVKSFSAPLIPRSYPSSYHEFFNMVPAAPEDEIDPSTERRSYYMSLDPRKPDIQPPMGAALENEPIRISDRIEERLKNDLQMRRTAAITAYRDAMSAGVADRSKLLDGLQNQLEDLRQATPTDFVPRLLLAHLAFEREHVATALSNLAEAVRCYPEIFVKKVDIGAFFGSREIYERQLRRYIQAGAAQNASPSEIVIEAYCALMLGDTRRAATAADRAAKAQKELSFLVPPTRPDVEVLCNAIKAATSTE